MKNILNLIFVWFVLIAHEGISQVNLVPNPSFEEYSECPDEQFTQFELLEFWTNPTTNSPDYFNACVVLNTPDGYGVPSNYFGNQNARTGDGYVGIRTMAGTNNSIREYIQVELMETLVENKLYCIEFYVSLADNCLYASNDIGAYFSETSVYQNNDLNIFYTPQINNNTQTNPLTDKENWIKVSGNFVSQGGEKFVTIGNFKSNDLTDTTLFFNGNYNTSYHYIDDISVRICDESSISELENYNVSIYPNPFVDLINIDIKNKEVINKIIISDTYGNTIKSILKNEFNGENLMEIKFNEFPKGIYFLTMEVNNNLIIYKLIKM